MSTFEEKVQKALEEGLIYSVSETGTEMYRNSEGNLHNPTSHPALIVHDKDGSIKRMVWYINGKETKSVIRKEK